MKYIDWTTESEGYARVTIKDGKIRSIQVIEPGQKAVIKESRRGAFMLVSTGLIFETPTGLGRFFPVPGEQLNELAKYH